MEEKKKLIKQSKIMIVMALVIVFVLVGTYAWMMITKNSSVVNKITAGTLDLILDESSSDGILIENTVPMSYQQGLTTQAYTFKLKNNSSIETDYTINLEDYYEGITVPTEGKIADSKIRYILLKDDETAQATNSKLLSTGREIEVGTIQGTTETTYTLYIWIDSQAGVEVNNQIFSGRLNITAEQAAPKYTVSGTLTDGEEQIVANATLLGFTQSGSQVVATTDSQGKFSMDNLPAGENKIYYVPTGLDISDKTKAEVDNMTGIASITINAPTSTQRAVMTNNYVIKDVITKKISSTSTNKSNSNILAAYTYNSSSCITGEEASCVATECYKTKTSGSCPAGTIIKYKVNESEEKYFHVLHDDGDKITMQQRENTIANTAWYSASNKNTSGPTIVLPVLENATSGWTNVNDLEYTLGTDTLYQNKYTGCDNYNSCSTNTYTLAKRTAKSRMITIQETNTLGCTNSNQSCPNWMNNYLYKSTSYGGTVSDNNTQGYWTMSAYYSSNYNRAWLVAYSGGVFNNVTTRTDYGARAVVEINK